MGSIQRLQASERQHADLWAPASLLVGDWGLPPVLVSVWVQMEVRLMNQVVALKQSPRSPQLVRSSHLVGFDLSLCDRVMVFL